METIWSRRKFLGAAALTTLGVAAGAAPKETPTRAKILVGSQLYGWGQYYERMGKKLADNLDEVLSAIQDCGYDYAETSMDIENPQNTAEFAANLKAKGMAPVTLYMTGEFHEADTFRRNVNQYLQAAAVAAKAGFIILNCNPKPLGREKTTAELQIQVTALRLFGEGLNNLGMRLGVHNHLAEMRNGGWEYGYNFRNSPSKYVGFCFDVDWVNRGGVAPLDALRDYSNRLVSWHIRQSRDGVWWEDVSTGDIDYEAVAKFARKYRLPPYYTVELALDKDTKVTRSVVENHKRSQAYVRSLFGA